MKEKGEIKKKTKTGIGGLRHSGETDAAEFCKKESKSYMAMLQYLCPIFSKNYEIHCTENRNV